MNDLIVNSDIRTLTEIKKHYCELFSNQINLSQFLYFSIYTLCWQLQLIIRQKESRKSHLRQRNHEIITNSSSLHCHALPFRSASVCVYISSSIIIHTYIKCLFDFFSIILVCSNWYLGASMDVQAVEKSNYGINVPTCYHGPCHALVPDCWCCEHLHHCWSGNTGQSYCNEQCQLQA